MDEDATEGFMLFEKEEEEISGWHVFLDRIWIHEGEIRADISRWSHPLQKPFQGGYRKGDSLQVGKSSFYVKEIKKFGKGNERAGYVKLTADKEVPPAKVAPEETISIEDTTQIRMGEVRFGLGGIWKEKDGKLKANIITPANSPLGGSIELQEQDMLWVGEFAYRVKKIVERKGKKNGSIVLERVKEKFISEEKVFIPGELMNMPPLPPANAPRKFEQRRYRMVTKVYSKHPKHRDEYAYWLLEEFMPDPTNPEIPQMPVFRNPEGQYKEFSMLRVFRDRKEAEEYAKENNIPFVESEK